MKLDLDWLRVFIEVYRTQNVSRAAERLGLPQANASVALAKLRRHFGDALFARTAHGMAPTPHAQAIYPEVLAAVEKLARLSGRRAVFEPANTDRVFRIGMTDISEIVVLPPLVNRLRQIARSSQSAAHMVNQLLAMARAEDAGPTTATRTPRASPTWRGLWAGHARRCHGSRAALTGRRCGGFR